MWHAGLWDTQLCASGSSRYPRGAGLGDAALNPKPGVMQVSDSQSQTLSPKPSAGAAALHPWLSHCTPLSCTISSPEPRVPHSALLSCAPSPAWMF